MQAKSIDDIKRLYPSEMEKIIAIQNNETRISQLILDNDDLHKANDEYADRFHWRATIATQIYCAGLASDMTTAIEDADALISLLKKMP